jgi:hypothetical protein
MFGNFDSNSTVLSGADYTMWRKSIDPNYDWAGHYHDLGYTDGKTAGDLAGDADGYNLTYVPNSLCSRLQIGPRLGLGEWGCRRRKQRLESGIRRRIHGGKFDRLSRRIHYRVR